MGTRADMNKWIKQATAIVKQVIHTWDPYGFIGMGAPLDEWDSEINGIVSQIHRIHSEKNAAVVISGVFSSAIQSEGLSPKECSEVGRQLFAALKDAGLIAASNNQR